MIILFISNRVDKLVQIREFFKAFYSSSYILGHIHRSSVRTQEQFLVQPIFGEINPYRAIFFFKENPFLQTFLHHLF
jgi:hypothetical protein